MSGLLRRLASQALRGTSATNAAAMGARIRPAVGIHAQAPSGSQARETSPLASAANPPVVDRAHDAAIPPPLFLPQAEVGEIVARASTPAAAVAVIEVHRAREEVVGARHAGHVAPQVVGSRLEQRAPPALLGEIAATKSVHVPMPVKSPRIALEPASSRVAAEPAEVHVHIGRIEVVAPPGAAKPEKKARAPRRDSRPLSEYLARRRPS